MSIKNPVSQPPIREELPSANWDRWFNTVSKSSIQFYDFDVVLNPSSVAASTSVEESFTVQGLGENDIPIALIKPSLTAGIGIGNIRVSAENTLSVTFINATAGVIDPPLEEYKLVVIRQ